MNPKCKSEFNTSVESWNTNAKARPNPSIEVKKIQTKIPLSHENMKPRSPEQKQVVNMKEE